MDEEKLLMKEIDELQIELDKTNARKELINHNLKEKKRLLRNLRSDVWAK